jgi:hypothetical protein
MAPAVTANDAATRGHIPNSGGLKVGYQLCPNKNEFSLTWVKTGNDSLRRVRIMPTRKTSEVKARVAKIHLYMPSFKVLNFFEFTFTFKSIRADC